ncbi:hypothetical protein BC832DRAFT_81172 [Gaertneriomyces semiglobifer]|nr:hypothetical protein BC832DRAFT_81172 [Gaertneriomyces semiglobifer]
MDLDDFLYDFIDSLDPVPYDITSILREISDRDEEFYALRQELCDIRQLLFSQMDSVTRRQARLTSRPGGLPVATSKHARAGNNSKRMVASRNSTPMDLSRDFPEQQELYECIRQKYLDCERLADEKVKMAQKSHDILSKYLNHLTMRIEPDGLIENDSPERTCAIASLRTPRDSFSRPAATTSIPYSDHYSLDAQTVNPNPPSSRRIGVAHRKRARTEKTSQAPSSYWRAPTPDTSDDVYCICQQSSYGEMIACDNEDCPHEWFHLDCVKLSSPPEGAWLCPTCCGTSPSP